MTERANWLATCEPKEALALIRSVDEHRSINYELLQICTDEQQDRIDRLMSSNDQKKYSLWQNRLELGMSDKSFTDFQKPENVITRTIDLPTSN